MNALIAFDKFKDALSADETCSIAARALSEIHPDWSIVQAPLADGGDGVCQALCKTADGSLREVQAHGPLGELVTAHFGIVRADTLPTAAKNRLDLPKTARTIAIVEMAQSSGIALLHNQERSPWTTSTYGLGELLRAARDAGADALIVGLGGSATHDVGLGALQALGYRFFDRRGKPLNTPPTPLLWDRIGSIEAPEAAPLGIPIRVACDVANPLVGPNGAAAVFGPQKGMKATDFDTLDSLTSRVAVILSHTCQSPLQAMDTPGAGAAGGCAFGLMIALGAQLVSGSELVAAWTDIESKLAKAEIVVTGEGRFDASSLQGKGPGYVLGRALELGRHTFVFAGSLGSLPDDVTRKAVFRAISPPEMPLKDALAATSDLLARSIRATFEESKESLERQFSANREPARKANT